MLEPTIFHFNCPLCGAHPKEQQLAPFLELWAKYPAIKIEALLNIFKTILKEILEGSLPWETRKIVSPLNTELELLSSVAAKIIEIDSPGYLITADSRRKKIASFDCPLCDTP